MDSSPYYQFVDITVRFSDLDAMGHVNNARYLTFFEEGRAAWFHDILSLPRNSFDYPVIVARIEIDYLAPIPIGSTIRVHTRCTRLGSKSMDVTGNIAILGKQSVTASQYKAVLVWYDYKTQSSIPIPHDARERIVVHEGL